ncbi:MAG: hypothetical protein WC608_00320 [Parcubacteria group bacterium]
MEEKNENIYVFEKSVELDKERLATVSKSMENERQKAGIIIGFVVLAFIESFNIIKEIDFLCIKIIIISFFLSVIIFSLLSFISVKMKSGIDTQGNFKRKWNNKERFLLFEHELLIEAIVNQKEHLFKIRQNIKFSVVSIFILVLLLMATIFL